MSASIMDWVLANMPELGILIFIGLCIWKYISWLDHKFSGIDTKFAAIDTKFVELRSDMNMEFVKVRSEMALGFAKVEAEIKLINHRLDDQDKRFDDLDKKIRL